MSYVRKLTKQQSPSADCETKVACSSYSDANVVASTQHTLANNSDSHPVQGADRPLEEQSSKSTLKLLALTPFDVQDSSAILPCALHMVKASSKHAFQVEVSRAKELDPITIPCQKIVCLIKSTTKSTVQFLDSERFKIVTRNVECVLADLCVDKPASQTDKFVLCSTCRAENFISLRLDPPHKGAQYALVTITSKLKDAFVVDQVEHLSAKQIGEARKSLWTSLLLACQDSKKELKRKYACFEP